jgi:putative addiction module killer protein
MVSQLDIQIYRSSKSGKFIFSDWLKKLEKSTQAIIDTRITRVRGGNFGDCKRLTGANGLFELRIDFGPGFRIYYGMHRDKLIILLCGGDKQSQSRDILKAKEYWQDYLIKVEKRK